jgi:hypothetical protein
MKPEFRNYLSSVDIHLTEPLYAKIEEIESDLKLICPEEIKAIFVNEYRQHDGKREYLAAVFFSDHYLMEARNILQPEKALDIAFYKNVDHVLWSTMNYNFQAATEKSAATLTFRFEGGMTMTMRASGKNCDALYQVFLERVKPNLKSHEEA